MAGRAQRGARIALDTVILGTHGEIQAGEEIPAIYEDFLGVEHETDFERLEKAGYAAPVADPKPEPSNPDDDGLDALKRPQLLERATELGVDVPSGVGVKNETIVGLIREKLAAQS